MPRHLGVNLLSSEGITVDFCVKEDKAKSKGVNQVYFSQEAQSKLQVVALVKALHSCHKIPDNSFKEERSI